MSSYLFRLLHLDKILTGIRAFTVQFYTEANVKNGLQFSASSYFTGLTAGEHIDIIIVTGAKPVIVKAQYLAARDTDSDVLSDWYKNPTYTGGTNITPSVCNQSDINPQLTTVTLHGPTPTNAATGDYSPNDATKPNVTNVGVKVLPTLATLGVSTQGSGHNSRNTLIGMEHVLAPNSVYLYRRTTRSTVGAMFGFSTWYEGTPDLPAALEVL